MTDKISSIGIARFDKASKPHEITPRLALEKALAEYDDIEEKPAHIIVLFGRDGKDEGGSATNYFQAGSYRHHAQMGLFLEAMQLMREDGDE